MRQERPQMDKSMSHQLDIKTGDTVQLLAISTTDGWHNSRHVLLFQEFVVIEPPTRADILHGYNYRNWMRARLVPVDKTYKMNEINQNESFYFARIQMKKISKTIEKKVKLISRDKMLLDINAELNNKPAPLHVPENPFSKREWKKLWDKGKIVQARKKRTGSKWYRAGQSTFQFPHAINTEFRLKE